MNESQPPRRVRYYPVARTAHLERQATNVEAWLLYSRTRDDFDESVLASSSYVVRRNLVGVLRFIWKQEFSIIEIPEPLAIRLWPQILTVCGFVSFKNFVRRKKIALVTYAIENFDPVVKLANYTPLSPQVSGLLSKVVLRAILNRLSRIVFGTKSSLDLYEQVARTAYTSWSCEVDVVEALPVATEAEPNKEDGMVCFVGSLEERKGVLQLLESWRLVSQLNAEARLILIGDGPLKGDVIDAESRIPSITYLRDVDRSQVLETISRSKTLVLLSQRTSVWREQIGLPILEGLQRGCEIVATTETGIQEWLEGHGHFVIEPDADIQTIASAIDTSLRSSRRPAEIQAELPKLDGREAADIRMFSKSSVPDDDKIRRSGDKRE